MKTTQPIIARYVPAYQSMHFANIDSTEVPSSAKALQARTEELIDMPVTPNLLFCTAPLMPQTCVPWP